MALPPSLALFAGWTSCSLAKRKEFSGQSGKLFSRRACPRVGMPQDATGKPAGETFCCHGDGAQSPIPNRWLSPHPLVDAPTPTPIEKTENYRLTNTHS